MASPKPHRWMFAALGVLIFCLNAVEAEHVDTTATISNDTLAVGAIVDPWFSKDKVYHFVLSYAWVAGSYSLMAEKSDLPAESAMAISLSSGIVLGLVKEIMDSRKPRGFFSRKDLIYNLAGAAAAAVTFRDRD